MSLGAVITGAAALSLAALPVYQELRRHPAPSGTPMARLSQGDTYYRWFGPENGQVAVCIHGLSTPSIVYHDLAGHLARMGIRVLVYDLYGRGSSSTPFRRQTPAFFARQFDDLLDHLRIAEPVTLIGYSMGGSIAAHLAAQNPDRFQELILLAPAGMGEELGRLPRTCAAMPVLGDWLFHLGYPKHHLAGLANATGKASDIVAQQRAELNRRGFVRSVLSSLRGTLNHTQEIAHRTLAKNDLPVTAIWGREDQVIPLKALGTLTQWNRNTRQIVIDGAGHGLPHTHAEEVVEALLDQD